MMLFIAACFLCADIGAAAVHGGLVCITCHRTGVASANGADGCAVCHSGYERILTGSMAKRDGEKLFVQRSYGRFDSEFWNKNCQSCHLKSCRDCHGDLTKPRKPTVADCQVCHKGYYTGWDFSGRAPREDNMRYQRGIAVNGETFLKMLPDVHYRIGMTCGVCHSMASLAAGKKSSKQCRDCHKPSMKPVEHRIAAHMERLECYACHSAWAAQEYGSFFLRFRDRRMKDDFDLKSSKGDEYMRSAYLRRQDEPPLGINSRGMISPMRPMFISYYTDIMTARNGGPENVLLAAQWRTYFPHTVQRGTVSCEGCHDAPWRFMQEADRDRIYQLQQDGMGLRSFWQKGGQYVANGSFMADERYRKMTLKSPAYKKAYIEKWQTILKHVDSSSSH